jgi:hypothetical protein
LLIFLVDLHYIYLDQAILLLQKLSLKILLVNPFIKSLFIFKFLQPLASLINLVFIYSKNSIPFFNSLIDLPLASYYIKQPYDHKKHDRDFIFLEMQIMVYFVTFKLELFKTRYHSSQHRKLFYQLFVLLHLVG